MPVPVPVPVSVSDSVVSSASLEDKTHVTSGEPLLSVVVLLPGCNWLTDAVVEEAEVTNSFGLWFEAMFVPLAFLVSRAKKVQCQFRLSAAGVSDRKVQ